MENKPYLVSARKYRPQTFEEVVGQKSITDTLSLAIKEKKMAQSILFSGPKGVGKTTCARILAKKINEGFLHDSDDLSFNVFELDGASNNSVEDIRNLIEKIRFAPQRGKYKVYIIDEVHMLSQAAFNAFLKTLEEPPPYVVFILATTEKHKVLPTILSRCQLYEFRAISTRDIAFHLKEIANRENIKASQEALFLIASQSEGSLRDALFLFDRLLISSNAELNKEKVEKQLGILPMENYSKVIEFISGGDLFSLLLHFGEILSKGFNIEVFFGGLAMRFRNLLLLKNQTTHALLDFPESTKEKLLLEAQSLDINYLLSALEICKKGEFELKSSKNPRLSIEITLMQLTSLKDKISEEPEKKNKIPSQEESKKEVFVKKEERLIKNPENEIKKIHKEQIFLEKKNISPSSFSIKEALEENQEECFHEKIIEEKKVEFLFSKEDFKKAWQIFLKELNLKKENPVFGILENVNFEVSENHKVDLYFSSRAAMAEFADLEKKALAFLKASLSNFSLGFNYKLHESVFEKKNLYTSEEKYDFFLKKNYFLKKLISVFKLDYL